MKLWRWPAHAGMAILAVPLLAHAVSSSMPAAPATTVPGAAGHVGANGLAAPTPSSPGAAPVSTDVLFYSLGVLLSQNLAAFDLSEHEYRQVLKGFTDGFRDQAKVADAQSFVRRLRELQHARQFVLLQHQKEVGAAFLAKVAAAPGARRTASGLVFVGVGQGRGAAPTTTDRVRVQYTGRLVDGTLFDSSLRHGGPATVPLAGIIPCWREALQLMRVGGKARVVCPSELAYGDLGHLSVPPGATLDFQIELLAVLPGALPAGPVPPAPGER